MAILSIVIGSSAYLATAYLATDLSEVGGQEAAAEGITAVSRVPWAELVARVGRGEITDNETLGALMLAVVALGLVRT